MSNPNQLVQKLWNYCNILRDEGLSYGDYVGGTRQTARLSDHVLEDYEERAEETD